MEKFVLPKGYKITFLGLPASGKTTLAEQLGKVFSTKVIPVFFIDTKKMSFFERAISASEAQKKAILSEVEKGETFITDSYLLIMGKTQIKFCHSKGLFSTEESIKLKAYLDEEEANKLLLPDLIIYLNVDTPIAVERIEKRKQNFKFFGFDNLEQITEWNQRIMSELKDNFSKKALIIEVNNNGANLPEKIADFICKNLDKKTGYIKYN